MSTARPAGSQRVAFVTGGASGIGEACARRLAAGGARVVVADRSIERACVVAASLGAAAAAVELDVTDADSCTAAVEETVRLFGRLDIAVNSAGVGVRDPADIGELGEAEWRRVLEVNLHGVFLSMRSEIAAMLGGGGSIVNIASIMGAVGTTGASAYVAAKHAVIGLTKAAALEYASRAIRVNAVAPGHVSTPMFSRHPAQTQAEIIGRYPVGRIADAAEVAEHVGFLAEGRSGFTTGACHVVDGGYTAQ